ncbi:MAG: DsbA family protein [Longimicrobiales bacterium]
MANKDSGGAGDMKKFYIILGVVAVAGIAALANSLMGVDAVAEPVDLGEMDNEALIELAQGMVYGDPNAPITIMEFGDYQCPACGFFGTAVKPQIDLAYIETGQAKLVFHDFPLEGHPHSFVAARAARCAGDQDQYFAYHDAIFRNQESWSPKPNAAGDFVEYAADLGLDEGEFRSCLESDRHSDVVSANKRLGELMGVNSTPTLLVHDGTPPAQRLGGFQFVDIQQAIEASNSND